MKKINLKASLIIVVVGFLLGTFCSAQIRETSTIHGKIQDEKGDVLPGAIVSISGTNMIGGVKTYISDKTGYYRFPSLPVGPYTISVELSGFQRVVRENISLHANMTLTVDFNMAQSAIHEEIIIKANPPTIDVTSNALGGVVLTNDLIISLPSSSISLSGLLAHATGTDYDTVFGSNNAPSYGLGWGQANSYMVDGVDVASSRDGSLFFSPDINIIQEASIQGLGLPAQYGNYTGTVMSTITKSGSNKFSTFVELRYNGNDWNSQNLGNIPEERFFKSSDKYKEYNSGSIFGGGLQLGGKIIHDKLWFFVSGAYERTDVVPLGTTSTSKSRNMSSFLKLSYQANRSNKINFSMTHEKQKVINAYAGPTTSPEADTDKNSPGIFFDFTWTAFMSSNSLLDVKLGYFRKAFDTNPKNDLDIPCHYDYGEGISYGNAMYYVRDRDKNIHGSIHFSQFIPQFIKGSHDIKVGTELVYGAPVYANGITGGGVYYYDYFGAKDSKSIMIPDFQKRDHKYSTFSAFVQDSWMLSKRLTFNLGFRLDNYWYKIPSAERGTIFKSRNLSPRIGFAFDLFGNRKTVLKIHYGTYFDKLYQSVFSDCDNRASGFVDYFWNGSDWEVWGYWLPNTSIYSIDPNLKQPYIREIIGGIQQELFKDASISVNVYHKSLGRAIGIVDVGSQWSKTTVINPGLDGIEGTSDDLGTVDAYDLLNPGGASYLLTNPKKGQAGAMVDDPKYSAYGFQVIFQKRYSNRWLMNLSYHYTRARGNASSTYFRLGDNPNNFTNAYGDIGDGYGQPHQLKLQTSIGFPLDFNVGISAAYISGAPKNPYFDVRMAHEWANIQAYPSGTLKYESKYPVDVRIEKPLNVGAGKFTLFGDVVNLLNSDRILNVRTYVGRTYDKIRALENPRRFRIGVRLVF